MSPAGSDTLLSLEDLVVEYGDETAIMNAVPQRVKERFGWESDPARAVDGVSLDVAEEEVVAVIGESGSGKTTLGKAAVGLEEPSEGSVRYRGEDIWELKRKRQIGDLEYQDARRSLQIIHQDPGASLNPYKTLQTILKRPLRRWFPELTHADCRERILGIFREVGLTPATDYLERYPHELSGGEQQRVALVRAMLVEPDLVLADEPVSALDPSLRISLMDLMLDLRETFETSFLLVSHNIQHARYIASQADGRIAVMYLGNIVEIGSIDEVLQDPKHPYTQVLLWASLPRNPDSAVEKLQAEPPLRESNAPDAANRPGGCQFHTRCPKARAVCADEMPPVETTSVGHEAACYRTDDAHQYWKDAPLDDEGEIPIPEVPDQI